MQRAKEAKTVGLLVGTLGVGKTYLYGATGGGAIVTLNNVN